MIHVIPLPAEWEERYGDFMLHAKTTVFAESILTSAKDFFLSLVSRSLGAELQEKKEKSADIRFLYDRTLGREAYRLDVSAERIDVYAAHPAGGLYAVQTLRQLLNLDVAGGAGRLSMHALSLRDEPLYAWRALMLDESRHFFGKDYVKKLIDLMSYHKLNVLHWHLTDNVGWRIEIKSYPKLTEIGSKRKGTQILAWGKPDVIDWSPYEGFYTQEDIKEIVAYASTRNVMVVPEINMPAHFGAALAAYPELSCRDVEMDVPIVHGGGAYGAGDIIACAGKENTYRFIYRVLDEVTALFPAPYVHIGGDEAPKTEWKQCAYCQQRMQENNLENEEELQAYFNNKIALYLKTKGKTLIGWNEILKAKNLDKDIVAQYWTIPKDARIKSHLAAGGKVIVSKHQAFYFDMTYAMRNLKTTYNYTAAKYGVPEGSVGVMGIEGTVWTEWIRTTARLEYQLFPRMAALAETAWTPENKKNYREFRTRLERYLPALDRFNVNYAPLSMTDSGIIRNLTTSYIYHNKDAHVEYKRAMLKDRRK